VLSIGKMVARSEEYYLRTVARGREEYYTGSGESPGTWVGEGSRLLGLEGQVDPDDLRAVLAGVSPDGEILTSGGRLPDHRRVSGFDLTWSAPKSVSLLYGLSEPEVASSVRAAHQAAVTDALGYLERQALRLRRGHDGTRQIAAEGLVAAAFLHRTSRAGDPQLHTHVLVANAARGSDGGWSAPDARLFYCHARAAGYLYQSVLRHRLAEDLGVRFGAVRRGMAELEGAPNGLLRAFSTRRREIEHLMEVTGSHSARAAEAAALVTRSAKETTIAEAPSSQGLREHWLERMTDLGVSLPAPGHGVFDHLLGQQSWRAPSRGEVDELLSRLAGPGGLTQGASSFERRDVVAALAEEMPQGAPADLVESLADQVRGRPDVVVLASVGRGGELRHTTTELLAVERSMLETAERLRYGGYGLAESDALEAALGQFPLLSDEQVQMVERITTSGAGVDVVVGRAGAGKTLALAAARQSWEASGYRVHGAALSARAARGLHDGAGIASDTLAKTLKDLERGRLRVGVDDVIVVDEAGMVGTRAMARVVETAQITGAKLVLVGDPRQLPEIEAGGALSGLISRLGAVELTENRRQREAWERTALDALRYGRAEVALATYERAGRVHTAPSIAEARACLVERWAKSHRRGDDVVMLAVGRHDVSSLNDDARATLRSAGRLGDDVLEVDGSGYALGDAVVCLRNDRHLGVVNGTLGRVERTEHHGLVIATADGERHLSASYLAAGHLGHGYALTVHKSQGMTVEQAFVLATESLSQEAGYVAMSRAKERTELFVPLGPGPDSMAHDQRERSEPEPLADIARRLGSSRAKQLAMFDLAVDEVLGHRRIGGPGDGTDATGEHDDKDAHLGVYGARRSEPGRDDGPTMDAQDLSEDPTLASALDPMTERHDAHDQGDDDVARWSRSRDLEPDRSRGLGR
jgi:conjugative relaxase-like TrwC/TraI family protein